MLTRTQASRPRTGPRTCLFLTPRTELMPRTYAHEPTSYILLDPHKSDVNVICQKIKSITNNWNQKTFSDVCKFYPCYNSSQFVSVQFWSINLSYVALSNITQTELLRLRKTKVSNRELDIVCSIWTHEQSTLREHTFHRCRRSRRTQNVAQKWLDAGELLAKHR